tara:strand:- start:14924 stop:16060 length:1137 start_codon:yes stop_codon:yes gene_type:complete
VAYSITSPNRFGTNAANTGAGVDALFLKVFSGEVLTTFEETNLMMGLHRVRTIASGKTAQFPVTGVASAKYHTPGESVLNDDDGGGQYLSSINHSEVTISIDGVLTSSAFIADIDEAKNHYDVRGIYSTEIGRALAYHADRAVMRTVIAGARKTTDRFGTAASTDSAVEASKYLGGVISIDGTAAATATHILSEGEYGGPTGTNATLGTQLFEGIFKAANLMDKKNVSRDGRYCILSPDNYYKLLTENKDAINRDFNPEGNGSLSGGQLVEIAGIQILKSTHLPSGDESSSQDANFGDNAINNDVFGVAQGGYSGVNFTGTQGIVFQTEGVGSVKLMDLSLESEYFMERMGTLMLAKYAMGHGVLRPEACYELVDTGS